MTLAKHYLIGFVLSVLLTLLMYLLVAEHWMTGPVLTLSITLLALFQAALQLYLFLNVGKEPKPYWNLTTFLFMAMVIGIIVFGSIWIMQNLNYNLMSM